MKVLVTGGAGFIGSNVSRKLLERGDQVVCIDNLNNYYSTEQKQHNIAQLIPYPEYVFHYADIANCQKMIQLFEDEKPDKVIHLAARAGVRPSIDDPMLYSNTNYTGTLNVLEAARRSRVKSFVFASSSSVYGNEKNVPFREDMLVDHPISPYAATKKAGELLCHTYSHLHNMNTTCLRFFTVYGPAGRPDMAPYKFVDAVHNEEPITKYGDGTSRRDYTYIDDIVYGIISALDADYRYEVFNLGNSATVSLNEFIETIEDVVGKKAIIEQHGKQPGDVDVTYADISHARGHLGYNPRHSIRQGMVKFYDWYIENIMH